MTTELELLRRTKLEDFFETAAKLLERVLTALLAGASGPESDSVEPFAHINNNAHYFVVTFVLESLANSRKLSM